MRIFSRPPAWQLAVAAGLFLNPILVVANPEPPSDQETNGTEQTEMTSTTSQVISSSLPENFVSDGQPLSFEKLGISIQPPVGWVVREGYGDGPSLIMEEPKRETTKDDYGKTLYQSNITVSVAPEPAPIDDAKMEELSEKLVKRFSENALVTNYQITEKMLFDIDDKTKGIRVFAAFQLNGVDMMHLHVFLSGEHRQFLLTYTDLSARFSAEDPRFETIWASMVSTTGMGTAPQRYEDLIKYSVIAGAVLLPLFLLVGLARRRRKINFDRFDSEDHDSLHDSDMPEVTATAVESEMFDDDFDDWGFADFDGSVDDEDHQNSRHDSHTWMAVDEAGELPETQVQQPIVESHNHRPAQASPQVSAHPKIKINPTDDETWVLPVKTQVSPQRFSNHG